MGLMSYNRVGSGGSGSGSSSSSSSSSSCSRGIKLNPRKFYVLRLRRRIRFLLTLFHKCKLSYSQALGVLRRVFLRRTWFTSSRRKNSYYCTNSLTARKEEQERIKRCGGRVFYARSNSPFYTEAIADCLEFIKRTSISMDQVHHQDDADADAVIHHVQD